MSTLNPPGGSGNGRNHLEFHPLADAFPLMEGAEFDELVADIKAHGLREPIIMYEGKILDGRNRYRACIAAGRRPRRFSYVEDAVKNPIAYVISKNIHRRHLTAEDKRKVIADLIKAQPEKSDRQHAKAAKVSPTFVGRVRAAMEEAGDVSTVDTRQDTRGREQPAKKEKAKTKTERARARADVSGDGNGAEPEASAERRKADYAALEADSFVRSSPLVIAWAQADPLQRRAFVHVHWAEIMQVRNEIDRDGAAQADHEAPQAEAGA